MEKTTKKKKSKRLKKRIGLIAVGGLSLVLTICLSVGATLAWFAGSTWSSQSLYMGGPVYVEMAGRGTANDDGTGTASWIGGSGKLDIQASTRDTGTAASNNADTSKVLLPGQKYEIYSQARVFSTAYKDSTADGASLSNNSGSNISNTNRTTGNGTYLYNDNGKITTTTTSVLRARFSVSIEFDPYVGFNNFTDTSYAGYYPAQSTAYSGDRVTGTKIVKDNGNETTGTDVTIPKIENVSDNAEGNSVLALSWESALGAKEFDASARGDDATAINGARRDAVPNADGVYTNATSGADMTAIKEGSKKSIYAWKFVTKSVYESSTTPAAAKMSAPFDGTDKNAGGTGYYGIWILDGENKTESNSFYSARCNSYLQSYVEEYITEYGGTTTRTIGETLRAFETDINNSFVTLINDSSDAIHSGYVTGMAVDSDTGVMTYNTAVAEADRPKASWLYVDSTIGNDTNTQELSTSVGGWWYLVETDGASAASNAETITTEVDKVTYSSGTDLKNATASEPDAGTGFKRASATTLVGEVDEDDTAYYANDERILEAKLYEITPDFASIAGKVVSTNGATKVVSYSFPFVNGSNVLPTTLTNIFANAKLTFQISFQAVQAFFPYSTTIDGLDYKSPIIGKAKALNIKNAIPIYNEAFAY